MKQTKLIMGMPITVQIVDNVSMRRLNEIFDFFQGVDERYSTYKADSEITQINNGLPRRTWSKEMCHILDLCEETKQQTDGYFDITHNGTLDPSGLVKGWAIWEAAKTLLGHDLQNFYIEAGGDIQAHGHNAKGQPWVVGIRNPFNHNEVIKTLHIRNKGIATSGTYIRGQHIYNPYNQSARIDDIQSLTVIGNNVYDADRFATAAFAMGKEGIHFIEHKENLEGYMIDSTGIATFTSSFKEYVHA